MAIKDVLPLLRRERGLTQEELARRLYITRQAVSRWERGETTPGIDMTKLIARELGVPVTELLEMPEHYCQSCGMMFTGPDQLGHDADGAENPDFCRWCYDGGAYTYETTMDEMIEDCAPRMAEAMGWTVDESASLLGAVLPTLERWRDAQGGQDMNRVTARKTLYLVGGPMGVGKSTVCRELNRMLPRSVLLDGDWCWRADPFQVTPETKALVLDNVCHLLGNFLRCDAYENVVFGWVMHERAIVEEILARLPIAECGAQVRWVSLVASEEELRGRIGRDVDAGLREPSVMKRALAYLPLYRELGSELVDTTGRSPREVAELVANVGHKGR